MSMIERVARAIYDQNAGAATGRPPWASAAEPVKARMRELAAAAIGEMREPTERMVEAAASSEATDLVVRPDSMYRNMIDAALKVVG